MSLLITPVSSEPSLIDNFWDFVRRVQSHASIQAGYAGPFTLEEAMQIAWRTQSFHIESAIEFRPTDTDPYEAAGTLDTDVEMGQVIAGFVGDSQEVDPPFGSELEYAACNQTHTRTAYVSIALATSFAGPGTPLVQAFVARPRLPDYPTRETFLYRDGEGFYIGVNLQYSDLQIPSDGDASLLTEQDGVTFTFYGKRVTVFAFDPDPDKYTGTTSIEATEPSPFWRYADNAQKPTYSATTGDPLGPIPTWME